MVNNPYIELIKEYEGLVILKNTEPNYSWLNKFKTENPLLVDLGCGSGNFLVYEARKNPKFNYVGVELKYKRLVKASLKVKKHLLENRIHFLQIQAENLEQWFPYSSIAQIVINFPDPWPKKRHYKNRLFQNSNLEKFHRLLVKNGKLRLKTDHPDYFEQALSCVQENTKWKIEAISEDLHQIINVETEALTEFETIFTRQNKPIFFLEIVKSLTSE